MKKIKLYSFKNLFYDFVKITSAIPGLLFYRPKWIYVSDNAKKHIKGGALLIANHTSYQDPIYVQIALWYRRHRIVCKTEMIESRGGFLLKLFRCLPIDNTGKGLNRFKDIINVLKNDELVSLFPEGHINISDKDIDEFKSGMVLIAAKAKVPIIPVYIHPRKNIFQRLRMVIGEAIEMDGVTSMIQMNEITKKLQTIEEEMKTMNK